MPFGSLGGPAWVADHHLGNVAAAARWTMRLAVAAPQPLRFWVIRTCDGTALGPASKSVGVLVPVWKLVGVDG
jgi:hypothetical protein